MCSLKYIDIINFVLFYSLSLILKVILAQSHETRTLIWLMSSTLPKPGLDKHSIISVETEGKLPYYRGESKESRCFFVYFYVFHFTDADLQECVCQVSRCTLNCKCHIINCRKKIKIGE